MPITSVFPGGRRILGWCVLITLSLSACKDAANQPLAVAVASETHPALLLPENLSTVSSLLSDYGLDRDGVVESEAWWNSWSLQGGEGASLRSKVYPSAAQRLFPVMGLAGVQDLLARNASSLGAVRAVGMMVDLEPISASLDRAEDLHSAARNAVDRGDGEEALVLALETADALWEVSPHQVATDLILQATQALGRNQAATTYSQEELIRIRRLTHGASEALDEGDYPRAIRRAYYACQLLGVNLL